MSHFPVGTSVVRKHDPKVVLKTLGSSAPYFPQGQFGPIDREYLLSDQTFALGRELAREEDAPYYILANERAAEKQVIDESGPVELSPGIWDRIKAILGMEKPSL